MTEPATIPVLFLRLEGPLQSWGDDSRWSVRRTRPEPTKSGVIGFLATVLGYGARQDMEIARLGRELRLAVRADRPGYPLRDYHTVFGGVLSAEGKIKINASTREPETVVSERYYLADACFLAALTGPEPLLDQIQSALELPAWPPFLGRKSCPPSLPAWPVIPGHPSRGRFADLWEALESLPLLKDPVAPRLVKEAGNRRAVVELLPGELGTRGVVTPRSDVPVSFVRRQFVTRYVCEGSVSLPEEATA